MTNNGLYKNIDSYVRNSRKEFEDKLAELVEIPSVSSEPDRLPDIRRCGEVAAQYLRDIGAKADDFAMIGVLQPRHNNARVQPAGVGEGDFFDVLFHATAPLR